MGDGMINNYTVYSHVNKINGKMYIGITRQKVQNRWRQGKDYKSCTSFNRAILKYGWDNFEHNILFENLSMEDAMLKECELIKEFNTISPNGYNLTSGGEMKKELSEETRNKIRIKAIGRKASEETKRKLSEINKGKVFSEVTIEKLRVANIGDKNPNWGKKASTETRLKQSECRKAELNPRALSVNQFDLNGNFIKTWSYIKKASDELNINKSDISKCCKGSRKTAGGFMWKYYDGGDVDCQN